jgi:hypothetical protein
MLELKQVVGIGIGGAKPASRPDVWCSVVGVSSRQWSLPQSSSSGRHMKFRTDWEYAAIKEDAVLLSLFV